MDNSTVMDRRDVDYALGFNRFSLSLVGLWPEKKYEKNRIAFTITRCIAPILSLWLLSFLIAPGIVAMFNYTFALDEFIELLCLILTYITVIARIIIVWYNEEASCISFITEDWGQKRSSQERDLMKVNARLGRIISIGLTIFVELLLLSFAIRKIFPLFHLKVTSNSTDLGKQLPFAGSFPFDLRESSNFVLVLMAQVFAIFFAIVAYTGTDSTFAMLITHLCGQIAILRRELVNLLENENSQNPETNFRKNIAIIVKRHDILNRFSVFVGKIYNSMLLVLVVVYTSQLGVQFFGLMTVFMEDDSEKSSFLQVCFIIGFLNTIIIHLFLYCYIGDMLVEESGAVGPAAYSCKWYSLSGRDAKDLLLVMHRAKIPFQISVGQFGPVSLELFANVLKTSVSYFSVLMTMKEQTSH